MTYKEKLMKERPERIGSEFLGGCRGCPHHYRYCEKSDTLCHDTSLINPYGEKCTICWNQTIPGTEEKKIRRLPPDKKKEWKATYAYFKDGHKEKVIYSTEFNESFFNFATESGVYAWNDDRYAFHSGARIKAAFCKCHTYRDERGDLRTMYLDATNVDHVDFEEVEVDA